MAKGAAVFKKIVGACKHRNTVAIPYITDEKKLLSGKTALIAGGSGAIGLAIAKAFLESGCQVILAGTTGEKLAKAAAKLPPSHRAAVKTLVLCLEDIASFGDKMEQAAGMFGRIDILVNAAGVHSENSDFWQMTPGEYDRVMDINLKGPFFLCKAAAEYMRAHRIKGHILLVSSSRGAEPAYSPYGVSKHGLDGLTTGLAKLLLPYGIIVNAIAPGSTATPLIGVSEKDSIYCDENGINRYILPDEVAAYAKLLVSELGNIVIGETVKISAGRGSFDIR